MHDADRRGHPLVVAGRGRSCRAGRSSACPCRRACAGTATGSRPSVSVLGAFAQAEGEPLQVHRSAGRPPGTKSWVKVGMTSSAMVPRMPGSTGTSRQPSIALDREAPPRRRSPSIRRWSATCRRRRAGRPCRRRTSRRPAGRSPSAVTARRNASGPAAGCRRRRRSWPRRRRAAVVEVAEGRQAFTTMSWLASPVSVATKATPPGVLLVTRVVETLRRRERVRIGHRGSPVDHVRGLPRHPESGGTSTEGGGRKGQHWPTRRSSQITTQTSVLAAVTQRWTPGRAQPKRPLT